MDEILIEEKKYVSSKRAAKVTGYAKDYIGQLCREGRVPARLIGRSWYVLESAIQDHRFGISDGTGTSGSPDGVKVTQQTPIASTWESPRYEASSEELLPPLNRLATTPAQNQEKKDDDHETSQHIQDSWKEWFDRFDHTVGADEESVAPEPAPTLEEVGTPTESVGEEVSIPIRTLYQLPPEEFLPHNASSNAIVYDVAVAPSRPKARKNGSRRAVLALQVVGVTLAISTATLAIIGSGYMDEYILSNSQVGIIAGVALYNK